VPRRTVATTEPTISVIEPAVTDAPTSTSLPPAPLEDQSVEIARMDLATRFGVDVDQIELVAIESVTWPSTALGCPTYGEAYEQRMIDGFRLVFVVGELDFTYHGAIDGGPPRLCEFLD
jgi:hypothetical protein